MERLHNKFPAWDNFLFRPKHISAGIKCTFVTIRPPNAQTLHTPIFLLNPGGEGGVTRDHSNARKKKIDTQSNNEVLNSTRPAATK